MSRPSAPTHAEHCGVQAASLPLAFEHMPKCGGSSITAFLRSRYPADRTLTTPGRNHELLLDFSKRPEAERHAVLLTVGHGAGDVFPLLRADTIRVTCFREPVQRILSYYRYVAREPFHPLHATVCSQRLGLDEFLESVPTRETRNYFVQRLSNLPIDRIEADPSSAARVALERLAHDFDIAGSLERLDDFAEAVARRARLLVMDGVLPRLNSAEEPADISALDHGTRQRIEGMNEADILFFEALQAQVGRRLIDGCRCEVV
jgi:hypothetical protein